MSFKVLHRGYQHIRLSSSFSLTLDIQDYLRSLAKDEKGIDSIQFYMDQQHFTLRMKEGFSVLENAEAFLKKIDKGKVSDLMTLPIRREESAYSIVSGAAIKRLLFRSFVPYPIRYIWTCYQALGYVKEAYQTLARKELTMEVLDCSAILLSLFMNQSKTASNIMFMLDLGNHLDQWSLKKTATDLEQSLLAKESDVFLVRGDMVISIKSSDVQVGDVLVVSQGNEILFDGQVVSGLGMVNESSLTGESFPVEKKEGDSVCANTVLETGELRIRVTDNQINSRILQLINLMKKSEESKKTKQRHFIRMADKVVKYNFLGAGLTYLLTGSFSKAISFLLVDFSCALKISTPVAYLTAIKEGLNREMVIKDGDVLDKEYGDFTAEMYSEGHSFFTYMSDNADSLSSCCRLRNEIQDNGFSYTLGAGGVSTGSKSVLTINLNRCIQYAVKSGILYPFFLEEVVDLVHKVQLAYNENLKLLQSKGMLPLFDAGYINMNRQYLTIGVNGLVEAAQFMGIEINDNPKYEAFVQEILGMIERYNRKYRTKDVLFNCEMIPAENVGVKHAKWDKEAGFQTFRECYNSYFYIVEDKSLNVVDKFRLHGRRYIKHLTGGSALHMNLEEHLSKEQYRQLLRVAAIEGCNYFTFNIPNTICNECKHIDKRYLHECPECHSRNVDYLTRVIGYMKRISNFSQARQKEAAQRYYAPLR